MTIWPARVSRSTVATERDTHWEKTRGEKKGACVSGQDCQIQIQRERERERETV